jgi:ankyrin repeat protein
VSRVLPEFSRAHTAILVCHRFYDIFISLYPHRYLKNAAMTGDYRLYERIPISEQDLELLDEPLYWAARKNNLTIVQRIIGRNRDADIMPAMMTAAASGHAEVLGFLLLNGGDRDAKYIGSSLLDVASGEKIIAVPKEREQAVIHTILSYGGPRAFRFAAERGLQDVVERILKQEPTVLNATGGCCTNTAIDLAARKGHGEIVRTLLSHYEDLPGKALISAAGRGYTKIVELFLQREQKRFR